MESLRDCVPSASRYSILMRTGKAACLTAVVLCFFSGVLWLLTFHAQYEGPPRTSHQFLTKATANTPSAEIPALIEKKESQKESVQPAKVSPLASSFVPWSSVSLRTASPAALTPSPHLPYGERVACLPTTFGYSKQQADIVFQLNKTFARCCAHPLSIMRVYDSGVFSGLMEVNCAGETAFMSLGLRRRDERLGNVKYDVEWSPYIGPVNISSREYAFARCGQSVVEAVLVNRFNATAAERANATTEQVKKEAGITGQTRPLAVYLVVFDSVSRQHFYRSFIKTAAFLNESTGVSIVDFEVNNAAGINTAPNMIPLLFGHDLEAHKSLLNNAYINRDSDHSTFLQSQNRSIWKHFESFGFVTLFGYDSVWDFLTQYIGREVATDHMVSNFYRAAKHVFGYDDSHPSARCFGCRHAHDFLLGYLRQYNHNYRGLNRFAYIHLSPGHESSGTVVRTADDDLKGFFEGLFGDQRQRTDEDFVVLLASDHGKHIGIDGSNEAFVENQLPFHLLIASDHLASRLQWPTLARNSKRLVTRYDWHLTLQHLATLPYGSLRVDSPLYREWKEQHAQAHAISLLLEAVPDSRHCQEAAVPLYFCACLDFNALEEQRFGDFPIAEIANFGVDFINFRLALSENGDLCQHLTLRNVTRVLVKDVEPLVSRYYKVRVTVHESEDAVFDIIALAAIDSRFPDYAQKADDSHPTKSLTSAKGDHLVVQISEVARVDVYSGTCEELAKAVGAQPQYCVCSLPLSDVGPLSHKVTEAAETLLSRLHVVLAPKGLPCEWTCRHEGRDCALWALPLLNSRYVLQQPYRDQNSYQVYIQAEKRYTTFRAIDIKAAYRQGSGVRLMRIPYEDAYNLFLDDSSKPQHCLEKPTTANMLCPCT